MEIPLELAAVAEPKRIRCSTPEAVARLEAKNAAFFSKAYGLKERLQSEIDKCVKMGEFCHSVATDPLSADRESVLQLVPAPTFQTMEGRMLRAKARLDRSQAIFDAAKGRLVSAVHRRAAPQLRKALHALKAVLRQSTTHNSQVSSGYALCLPEKTKKDRGSRESGKKKKEPKKKEKERNKKSSKKSAVKGKKDRKASHWKIR